MLYALARMALGLALWRRTGSPLALGFAALAAWGVWRWRPRRRRRPRSRHRVP
jgi:hypothetical protein